MADTASGRRYSASAGGAPQARAPDVAANGRRVQVAGRRRIDFLFRLVLIAWIVVTIVTLGAAVLQWKVRSAQHSSLQSPEHRASSAKAHADDPLPSEHCSRACEGAAVSL